MGWLDEEKLALAGKSTDDEREDIMKSDPTQVARALNGWVWDQTKGQSQIVDHEQRQVRGLAGNQEDSTHSRARGQKGV